MENPEFEEARKRREKNAVVRVVPHQFGIYEHEAEVQVAHNGSSFTTTFISEKEAETLVEQLIAHFKLDFFTGLQVEIIRSNTYDDGVYSVERNS
jgi:hypothetical protein